MKRTIVILCLVAAAAGPCSGIARATTRDMANLAPARLSFDESILNLVSYGVYRGPYDELQTRPYNLLFANDRRYSTLSPWQGQESGRRHYLDALFGNNGAANVDNDADALQGAYLRRETPALSWGASAAFLMGNDGSRDTAGTSIFSDADDMSGYDLRGAAALQISERRVLGGGLHLLTAGHEITESSFEEGSGGFLGTDRFEQQGLTLDFGVRTFRTSRTSWEALLVVGMGTAEQDSSSEDRDDAGEPTGEVVITNYDLSDRRVGLYAGYNRLRPKRLGETEFRVGLEQAMRELSNTDLAYSQSGGTVTPSVTLVEQDPLAATRAVLSAKTIFQAGETEVFGGAQLALTSTAGSTLVDSAGTPVREEIDDSEMSFGLTLGLRQPLFRDRIRFLVSGRADLLDRERGTIFDTSSETDSLTRSSAQYAVGLEGVLANMTFDVGWLFGEEAPVVPVDLGLPGGSRRALDFDRLVFSAAVSW